MGNKQPKKKNSKEKLSLEMLNLIEETEKDIMKEYPSLHITEHLFFLTALDIEGCFLYEALAQSMSRKEIERVHDQLKAIVETETLNAVKPKNAYTFSDDFSHLLDLASNESILAEEETITSDHLLLAFIKDKKYENDGFREILKKADITYDMVKEGSKEIAKKLEAEDDVAMTASYGDTFQQLSDVIQNLVSNNNSDNVITYTIGLNGENGSMIPLNGEDTMNYLSGGNSHRKKKKDEIDFCSEMVSLSKKSNDRFVGGDKIIDSIISTMAKKKESNVVLVGESGVGKTALIHHIAKCIANDDLPEFFAKRIYNINFPEMMSGTQFRGVFEGRIKTLVDELEKQKDSIAFIDNIQDLIVSDSRSDDFSGVVSGILNNENIKLIITTTPKGYKTLSDKYKSISKKFQKIVMEQPQKNETVSILQGLKADYEKYHNVTYPKDVAETCTILAMRYLNDRCLPISAINLMDEVGAAKKLSLLKGRKPIEKELSTLTKKEKTKYSETNIEQLKKDIESKRDELAKYNASMEKAKIEEEDIFNTVSKMSNIPIAKISLSEKITLKNIDDSVKKVVIGQDEAIEKICKIIKRNKMGLAPDNKPIGSFLCVGGTGCGKTLMAKTIAKEVFGDEKYLVRFDMSEYSDETSVNKLIGSSAGYVGYTEGGLLTEAVKNQKYAVVLFDEIEKANDKVFNLFLQVLDEGCLTDNMGDRVDFKNTIIIMTSNVGVKDATLNNGIGFNVDNAQNRKNIIEKSLKSKFAPEFLNRLNDVIYFNDLTDDNLKDIIKLEINKLIGRLHKINFDGKYGDKTIDFIYEVIKQQKEYGARPIARAIQDNVENKITDLLLDNDYGKKYIFDFDKIIN